MSNTARPAEMRKSNLELFRIIAMLLIVAHHYVVQGGLLSQGPVARDPLSFHSQFILLFGAWGKIGINCFILFSGYFMCKKTITLRKFLKLLFEILFYKALAAFLFGVTGYHRMSFPDLVLYLLPVRELYQDFYAGYLVFFLFIPFLNILVRHMNEKTHVRLLALVFFSCIFLGSVPDLLSVTLNNTVWFMALYIISSYIRLYPKEIFDNRRFWRNAALLCLLVSALSVVIASRLVGPLGKGISSSYAFVMDSNAFLAVLTALSAFLYFKNAAVPQSRFINTVASATFGVLLIHANGAAMRKWLWGDVLHTVSAHATLWGIPHAFLSVAGVFVAAACLDLLRVRFIEKPFFRLLDRILPRIEGRWKRWEEKFFQKCHIS